MFQKATLLLVAAFSLLAFAGLGCKCTSATPLTGTTWVLQLDTLTNVQNPAEKPEKEITLVIAPDHKVSGCAGVNNYFGKATVDTEDHDLIFSPLGATLMAGPGMNYEVSYLQTLALVEEYQISGKTLTLMGDEDVPLLIYTAK